MKHRQLRVNELVKRELSAIIAREINFGGVLVSINAVDVTPDLKSAHVFVSILGAATGASVIDKLEAHRPALQDRKSTRLNSSHITISYAVFCLKKKKKKKINKETNKKKKSKKKENRNKQIT